jgi:hypothetical protein
VSFSDIDEERDRSILHPGNVVQEKTGQNRFWIHDQIELLLVVDPGP